MSVQYHVHSKPQGNIFLQSSMVGLDRGGVSVGYGGATMNWWWSLINLGAGTRVLVGSLSGGWCFTTLKFDDSGESHQ